MHNEQSVQKNLITACLVICNAEKFIERCLKSIKDVADEIIIIIDEKSEDQTYGHGKCLKRNKSPGLKFIADGS